MKLAQILYEGRHFATFADLLEFLETAALYHFGDIGMKLRSIDVNGLTEMLEEFPEIAYKGTMTRMIMVPGSHPNITVSQVAKYRSAGGLQSWARTENGVEEWLMYHDDMYPVTDVWLQQQGVGLSFEKVILKAKKEGLAVAESITRAASVEEVLAPYQNPRIIKIEDHTDGFDQEDIDDFVQDHS